MKGQRLTTTKKLKRSKNEKFLVQRWTDGNEIMRNREWDRMRGTEREMRYEQSLLSVHWASSATVDSCRAQNLYPEFHNENT